MKSRQGVSKARVTKPQLEVLRRMAYGETLVTSMRRGDHGYLSDSPSLVNATTIKILQDGGYLVAERNPDTGSSFAWAQMLTPAGRALVEDSRREK